MSTKLFSVPTLFDLFFHFRCQLTNKPSSSDETNQGVQCFQKLDPSSLSSSITKSVNAPPRSTSLFGIDRSNVEQEILLPNPVHKSLSSHGPSTIIDPSLKSLPTKTFSNYNIEKTSEHGRVDVDPLFCDLRKPEAKVFACKCGKNYFSHNALGLHLKTMKFGNVYTCKYCFNGFRHFNKLQSHVKRIHNKPFDIFLCGFCHKKFQYRRALTEHLLSAHDN